MSNDMTKRNEEPTPASAGSAASDPPVGWTIIEIDGDSVLCESPHGKRMRVQLAATLTDAEREVLGWAIEVSDSLAECGATGTGGEESHESSTLRGLLERLK